MAHLKKQNGNFQERLGIDSGTFVQSRGMITLIWSAHVGVLGGACKSMTCAKDWLRVFRTWWDQICSERKLDRFSVICSFS